MKPFSLVASVAGMVLAVLAIARDDRRLSMAAIVLLGLGLLARVILRRQARIFREQQENEAEQPE